LHLSVFRWSISTPLALLGTGDRKQVTGYMKRDKSIFLSGHRIIETALSTL
jgi:hypothetical protein